MFQTGSQINPSLGRTDYSAYAQGAIAGGQAIGQGIANLGQGLASGIEAYTKKKEENKKLDDATSVVSNLVKSDPKIAAFFNLKPNESGEYDLKAIKSAVKTVGAGPILQLAQQNQEFNRTQENESRTAQAALALGGVGMGPVLPENRASVLESRGFTPQQITAAQAYDLNRQAKLLELNKTAAETAAIGVPKAPNLSFQEQQLEADIQSFVDQYKRQPTSTEKSKIMGAIARAPVAPLPDAAAGAIIAQQVPILQATFSAAESVPAKIASIHQQKDLINSGQVPTGILSTIESSANTILSLFGNKSAEASAARTAEYDKLLSKTTFDAMQTSGLRATQLNTEKEWERFNNAIAAVRTNPKEAALAVLDLNEKAERAVLEQHNKNRKAGKYKRFLDLSLIPYSDVEMPPAYSSKKPTDTIDVGGKQIPSANSFFGNPAKK